MFSYYALETWLFSFFALLLLGFIIFYTKRLIIILADMRKSNKIVSYKPWEMEKKLDKAKAKIPRRFGPIKVLVPVREPAISTKKQKSSKSAPLTRMDAIDGQIATIDVPLSRCSSDGSGLSYETTTTNSEFYREGRLSVSEDIKDDAWFHRLMVDQGPNIVKNELQAHLSAAAVENLRRNLPKAKDNNNNNNNSNNNNNARNVTKEDDHKIRSKVYDGVILVTPEVNELQLANGHHHSRIVDNKETVEMISKVIPVLDESFTSSSTTVEGNSRSTITKTTNKKVTLMEISKRKQENRLKI